MGRWVTFVKWIKYIRRKKEKRDLLRIYKKYSTTKEDCNEEISKLYNFFREQNNYIGSEIEVYKQIKEHIVSVEKN